MIITTYDYVTAEYRRITEFAAAIKHWKRSGKQGRAPKRPRVVLLTDLWKVVPGGMIATHMVLDEAHAIKNVTTQRYKGIVQLRQHVRVCTLLTGTPFENHWHDAWAYLSLARGHPIDSFDTFHRVFCEELMDLHPSEQRLDWLIELFKSFNLCRSPRLVTGALPSLEIEEHTFKLPRTTLGEINEKMDQYRIFKRNSQSSSANVLEVRKQPLGISSKRNRSRLIRGCTPRSCPRLPAMAYMEFPGMTQSWLMKPTWQKTRAHSHDRNGWCSSRRTRRIGNLPD